MAVTLALLLLVPPLWAQPMAKASNYEVLRFHSEEVRKGKIEESGDLHLYVLLPPSYASSPERRYPVVYCFHGYGCSGSQLIDIGRLVVAGAMKTGVCPEFLMVGVDGTNTLGGSFYADSPATGNWESMVTKEVLPCIDAKYRTLASPEARGLAGFSMGGFAAWNIGLNNPDLFSWVWSCCPGALAPGGLEKAIPTWDGGFMRAYGAVFAPDLSREYPYDRRPTYKDGSVAADETAKLWSAGFGDIEGKLRAYLSKPARLRAIHFDCADNDYYGWIPEGTKHTARAMQEAGVNVSIDATWRNGHNISSEHFRKSFVPFFAKAFETEPAK